jgi:hypothetical protein
MRRFTELEMAYFLNIDFVDHVALCWLRGDPGR